MAGIIVHEWLEKSGGAEKVVEAMCEAFPEASLQVLWNDAPQRFPDRVVRETWLASTPLRRSKSLALPFMPLVWRNLTSEKDVEWLLVSSHLFAHHAKLLGPHRDIPKFVYAHTPARYIWNPELDARGNSPLVKLASTVLKPIDRRRAIEATSIAANSEFVRRRIQLSWNVDAQVIYPPVNVTAVQSNVSRLHLDASEEAIANSLPDTFLLGVSRFVPYKRLDQVIRAGEWSNVPVVIAGNGPEKARLVEISSVSSIPVIFIDRPSDALLALLYSRTLALVFPALEDFGIIPVEAMAAGTPVIGLTRGGVSESVLDGVTGALIESFDSPSDFIGALEKTSSVDSVACANRASDFDSIKFKRNLFSWLGRNCAGTPEMAGS
jgi:glycosyltransferase involved in cell wall biosynthesis